MEKILARVGALTVTDTEVEEFLLGLGQRGRGYDSPEGRRVILNQLIGNKLLLQEARRNLYEAEPAFREELAKVKDSLLINYAGEKALSQVKVTDDEVKSYYEANGEKLSGGPTVNAGHILVDSEERANEILADIKSGKVSFEDAAKEFSSCPSGQNGGSLGEFGRGQMVPEFDTAVFAMEAGEVTDAPVKTQFGYHLIKVYSKNDGAVPPLSEVDGMIRDMLLNEKRHAAYDSKINQLKIMFPVDIVG